MRPPNLIVVDFEFVEGNPCLPISVGLARENSNETFYAEFPDAMQLATSSDWLTDNVSVHLEVAKFQAPSLEYIKAGVIEFLGTDEYELMALCGAYDFFLLSQLLGGLQNSPPNFPRTYFDLAHLPLTNLERTGYREHHALDDCLFERDRLRMTRLINHR